MKVLTILLSLVVVDLFGQSVQNFSLLNVADDSMISLESYSKEVGVVVIFSGLQCAYDEYYTARIKALIDIYKGKIPFLLINSYIEPEEAVARMKTAYTSWGMNAPYLADKDQTVMGLLGARKSPEVFLLKNNDSQFSVFYSGAIDDNPQVSAAVSKAYLREAINQLLAGKKPDVENVRAVGCSVRRK
jgi:hypothetical protein